MQKSLKRSDDNRLSKEQTHGIALLSVGTFLEYFDFMLHVHLAVVLNDLFFPKGDPKWDACIPALTFSSNFIFRPFGGLLFGYIGDLVGRKVTIILTTVLIAICCITVASLPTYAQIGILAPILLHLLPE
jgi:MHS family proline/betaine transporter-like MFS transporter